VGSIEGDRDLRDSGALRGEEAVRQRMGPAFAIGATSSLVFAVTNEQRPPNRAVRPTAAVQPISDLRRRQASDPRQALIGLAGIGRRCL
jgi:hypothetical protein